MTNYHVSGNRRDGYDAKQEGALRSSGHFNTQHEAELRSKQILARNGGGEVVIHDVHGLIRDKDTVAPANDPRSSKDSKH